MSAPAVTDNFTQVAAAGTETTLAAPGKSIGASSVNLTNAASWPTITGIIFAMRRVDSNGNYVAGTYTEWAGVLSGSTITLNTTPLYGTDQTYAADGLTQVYIPLSYNAWNRVINTILQQHTQAGAHVALTNTGGANFTGGITTDSLVVTGSNIGAGWSALGQTLTYATNNSQKEFTCTAPADLTSVLSPGMRLQITRNTVPPTQCMAFVAASSQYATKASPTGITFTGPFTVEAWIYVTAYPSGGNFADIITRSDNSTGGWSLQLKDSGQIRLFYGAASAFTDFVSNQSVPLNRWVHVAGVVTSVASKTGAIYLNGLAVPSISALSAATTLAQVSNLTVGNISTGLAGHYFSGYISEGRVWATNQSQSAVLSNMAISLTGSESNLIALFQGNGNFNDKTSNANNLTANGGAIATQAANPYSAIEYALVTKVSYSNPTTTITLFTGTDYTIPNMTLNSAQYSLAKVPFGFPVSKNKWRVENINRTNTALTSNATYGAFLAGGYQLSVPTGEWDVGHQAGYNNASTVSVYFALASVALTGLSTTAGAALTNMIVRALSSAAAAYVERAIVKQPQVLAALTVFTMYTFGATTAGGFDGTVEYAELFAESAYI